MKKHVAWHIVRACLLPAVLFSSRALADCAQDFARDNAYKPHAGAIACMNAAALCRYWMASGCNTQAGDHQHDL